jgi:signal transduction histidine kinase
VYWLKFQLDNPQKTPLLLQLAQAIIPSIDFYAKADTSLVWQVQKAGFMTNLYEKSIQHHHQVFQLPTQSGTYFMRTSGTIMTLPFSIKKQAVFELHTKRQMLIIGLYIGLMLFVTLHNLFLFVSLRRFSYLHYAIFAFSMLVFVSLNNGFIVYLFPNLNIKNWYIVIASLMSIIGLSYAISFLNVRHHAPRLLPYGLAIGVLLFGSFFWWWLLPDAKLQKVFQSTLLGVYIYIVIAAITVGRRGNQVGYYFAITYIIFFISFIFNSIHERTGMFPIASPVNLISWGILIEVLLQSFLLTKRFEWEKADMEAEKDRTQAQLLEKTLENEQIVREQNVVLEGKVTERTAALEQSLVELHETQNQLIQKEKLASLGELTAGIAHEIQNPLNFVNNFSELSVDLVKELKDEIGKSSLTPEGGILIADKTYFDELFTDLSQNQEKINHHGKRASNIVKGMLEHSRTGTGEKQLTDINALCDEYLRLAYHGMRSKDRLFNAELITVFDPDLPIINVVPQEISRVLLNLINNAFYAINKKAQNTEGGYFLPKLTITTQKKAHFIEICVQDNGGGIPEAIVQKIFQPFFTNKPTGEGTGLGLSLSYDIVTKGYNGSLTVENTEGVGACFVIQLPIK